MSDTRRGNREGTYWRRPNGGWSYRVMVEGRRVTTHGKTKSEAKAKAVEKVKTLGSLRSALTVEGLLQNWAEKGATAFTSGAVKFDGLAPTTFDQYRYLLGAHVVPVLGSTRVDALTKRRAVEAMNAVTGSASTRRSTYAAMVKVMEYARRQGIVGANVMREVDRPEQPAAKSRDITTDEALRILSAAQGHRWEVAVWLGLGAGFRRGEILGLRWADVDLEAGTAHVLGNLTRSSAGLRRGDPKTKRGKRIVPLPDEVVGALRAHRLRQLQEQMAAPMWQDSGHVLTNEVGGPGEPRKLSRVWSSWARKAKVEDRGTHVGRHFAASTLLASGMASVADVAAMLGHDPSVLLNTYAVAAAKGQRAASDVLGATLRVASE